MGGGAHPQPVVLCAGRTQQAALLRRGPAADARQSHAATPWLHGFACLSELSEGSGANRRPGRTPTGDRPARQNDLHAIR
jgi:hypothetical protein